MTLPMLLVTGLIYFCSGREFILRGGESAFPCYSEELLLLFVAVGKCGTRFPPTRVIGVSRRALLCGHWRVTWWWNGRRGRFSEQKRHVKTAGGDDSVSLRKAGRGGCAEPLYAAVARGLS